MKVWFDWWMEIILMLGVILLNVFGGGFSVGDGVFGCGLCGLLIGVILWFLE